MKLWVDVCDATWTKMGAGPVLVKSATIDRVLDGAGTISLECVATDERTLETLTNEKRVKVYLSDDAGTRLIAKGVIRNVQKTFSQGGLTLSVSGPDSLDDLKRYSVLLNRQYTQLPRNEVLASLAGLAGWSVEADETDLLLSARFDGVSVLSALQKIAEQNGLHLREVLSESNTLQIGTFGDDCGLVAVSGDSIPTGVYANTDVAIIESIQKSETSEAIANWLIPIGAGEGEASLTLRYCTRDGVKTMTGADGRALYYITDEDSIATYGVIQKAGTFKDIAPLTNSPVSKQIASNALYDAAKVWLNRNSVAQVTYSISLKKVAKTIRPGDKIRVKYVGDVETKDGKILQLEKVDALFWVVGVSESYTPDGMSVRLEISNVDQVAQSTAKTIIGALEGLRVQNLKPATTQATFSYVYTDFLQTHFADLFNSANKPAEFVLNINNSITEITRVLISVKTKPLYSLVDVLDLPLSLADSSHDLGFLFGVRVGSQYPKGLRMYINGVDVTAKYGGPWNPSPTNAPVNLTDIDITEDIVASGIYRQHTIVFRCEYTVGSGVGIYVPYGGSNSQGLVELTMNIEAISQAILPT